MDDARIVAESQTESAPIYASKEPTNLKRRLHSIQRFGVRPCT
jgi:hypothetical protein